MKFVPLDTGITLEFRVVTCANAVLEKEKGSVKANPDATKRPERRLLTFFFFK